MSTTSAPIPNPFITSTSSTSSTSSSSTAPSTSGVSLPPRQRAQDIRGMQGIGGDSDVDAVGGEAGADSSASASENADVIIDIGYQTRSVPLDQFQANPAKYYALIACCPCCVGNPAFCSPENMGALMKLVGSFIAWISLLQCIMFLASLFIGGFVSPSENPMLGPSTCTLLKLGAKYGPNIIEEHQVWRLLTNALLHSGIIHIAFNMLAQLSLGITMEFRFGTKLIAPVYLISAFAAGLLSTTGSPMTVSVGASGAILGLVGVQASHLACNFQNLAKVERQRQLFQLVFFLFVMIIIGSSAAVDNLAHAGGFIAGAIYGFMWFVSDIDLSSETIQRWIKLSAAFALFLFCFVQFIFILVPGAIKLQAMVLPVC